MKTETKQELREKIKVLEENLRISVETITDLHMEMAGASA